MEYELNKKKKSYLKYKIPMFLIVISYLIFFIYQFMTKDFDINKNKNLIQLISLFVLIFLLGLTTLSNSKLTIVLSLISYIIIIYLAIITFNIKFEFKKAKKDESSDSKEINVVCNGKTDTSDTTTVEINYKDDTINKITYTYIFDEKNKTGAENLVNHFDKTYLDYSNIYSEITIKDNIEVKFYYNLDNVDIKEIQKLDEKISNSYKTFEKENLNNLECKTRD